MNPMNQPTKAKQATWFPNRMTGGHPMPSGVQVLGHKTLGRMVICQDLRTCAELMKSPFMASVMRNGNGTCPSMESKVDSPKWRGLPKKMWKKSWGQACGSVYTAEPHFDEDTRKAVMKALPQSVRLEMTTEWQFSDKAGGINLPRLFDCKQKFMRRMRTQENGVPVIGLGVNVSANANINAEIAGIRGQVATIAAKVLENRGYMVEIYAIEAGGGAYRGSRSIEGMKVSRDNLCAVKIKSAGETFIESHVANALSAWFFRTGFFQMIRLGDAENVDSGLGSAKTLKDEDCENVALNLNLDSFTMLRYTPYNNDRSANIANAVKSLVEDVLEKYPSTS